MFISDYVFDNGLSVIDTDADQLHICSSDPGGSYASVTASSLASASISVGAPSDAVGNGRRVTVPAVSGGTISSDGTATHWAVVDVSATRVLASGSLSSSQQLYTTNTFNTSTFDIIIRDAA